MAQVSVRQAVESAQGILRLAPTWVPRPFLMPGRRIKLAPQDIYAYGAHRGGIDERWFASTTEAANEGRVEDEGLSYVVVNGKRGTSFGPFLYAMILTKGSADHPAFDTLPPPTPTAHLH